MYIKNLRSPWEYLNVDEYLIDINRWLKEYEKIYTGLMEEIFCLVYYGHFSELYIASLTNWERHWYIKRLVQQKDKEMPKENKSGRF